jgi:hypothetical protein
MFGAMIMGRRLVYTPAPGCCRCPPRAQQAPLFSPLAHT